MRGAGRGAVRGASSAPCPARAPRALAMVLKAAAGPEPVAGGAARCSPCPLSLPPPGLSLRGLSWPGTGFWGIPPTADTCPVRLSWDPGELRSVTLSDVLWATSPSVEVETEASLALLLTRRFTARNHMGLGGFWRSSDLCA